MNLRLLICRIFNHRYCINKWCYEGGIPLHCHRCGKYEVDLLVYGDIKEREY